MFQEMNSSGVSILNIKMFANWFESKMCYGSKEAHALQTRRDADSQLYLSIP